MVSQKNLDDLKGEEMSGPPARNSLWKRHVKKSTFFRLWLALLQSEAKSFLKNHYLVLSQLQQQSKKITVHQERIQIMTWKSGCVAKIKQFSGPVPSRKRDAILGRDGGGDRRKITSLDLGLRLFLVRLCHLSCLEQRITLGGMLSDQQRHFPLYTSYTLRW